MSAHRYRLSESSGVNVTEPVREEGTDLKRHETQAGQPRRSSSPPSLLALQQQQLLVEAQLQQLQVFQQQQELYDFQRRQQQRLEQQHRLASIHHSAAHAAAASAAKFFAGMGSHTGLHTGAFGGGPGAVVPPPLQPPLQPFAGPASSTYDYTTLAYEYHSRGTGIPLRPAGSAAATVAVTPTSMTPSLSSSPESTTVATTRLPPSPVQLPLAELASSTYSKRRRRKLSAAETQILMTEYERCSKPNAQARQRLAMLIPDMTPRAIQIWFQNKRAKFKSATMAGKSIPTGGGHFASSPSRSPSMNSLGEPGFGETPPGALDELDYKYATMSTTSSSEDLHAITDEDMIWEDDETLAYNGSEEDLPSALRRHNSATSSLSGTDTSSGFLQESFSYDDIADAELDGSPRQTRMTATGSRSRTGSGSASGGSVAKAVLERRRLSVRSLSPSASMADLDLCAASSPLMVSAAAMPMTEPMESPQPPYPASSSRMILSAPASLAPAQGWFNAAPAGTIATGPPAGIEVLSLYEQPMQQVLQLQVHNRRQRLQQHPQPQTQTVQPSPLLYQQPQQWTQSQGQPRLPKHDPDMPINKSDADFFLPAPGDHDDDREPRINDAWGNTTNEDSNRVGILGLLMDDADTVFYSQTS